MSQVKHDEPIDDGHEHGDDDICSIGSEWTVKSTSIGTTRNGNAQGDGSNSMNALLEVPKQFFWHNLGYLN
jgi:hypothetical protein